MKCYQRKISTFLSAALLCVSGINSTRAEPSETIINKAVPVTNSFNCSADSSWFTHPSLPTEVKQSNGPGDSSFCDFYQFSWQSFAYLMATSKTNPQVLNFQDSSQFNELEVNADGSPANSCDLPFLNVSAKLEAEPLFTTKITMLCTTMFDSVKTCVMSKKFSSNKIFQVEQRS
jgi:hypothetical protein